MLKWLASLVFSSLTFAIADVLCDICIAERDEELKTVESAADDEDTELEEVDCSQAGASDAKQDRYARDSDGLQLLGVTLSRPNAGPRYKQVAGNGAGRAMGSWSSAQPAAQEELVALTGEQDAAIAGAHSPGMRSRRCVALARSSALRGSPHATLCRSPPSGIVTILMLLVTVVYTICQTWSSERSNEVLHLRWGPTTHVQFWFAMLGGSCAFMHYFFLLKAFEGAPSTVLLPLVQARGSRACAPARLRACPPGLRLPAWPPARRRPPACCQPHLRGAAAAVWRGRWRRSPCSSAPR